MLIAIAVMALILLAVLTVFLGYLVVVPVMMNLGRFLGARLVYCPHRLLNASIDLNAFGAALSTGLGLPKVRVAACNLRSKADHCDEGCLKGLDY